MDKQRWEESERRRAKEERSEKIKSEKKEDAGARKGRKVAIHCVVPMMCAEGRKVGSLKRQVRGEMRDEKLHAVAARRKIAREKTKNTWHSEHFWKLRCPKSARSCGMKHISKSKGTKHTMFGPLLEVAISKKCTPLWCEAHFEVKTYKTGYNIWTWILTGPNNQSTLLFLSLVDRVPRPHAFDPQTSKSAPRMVCFVTSHFQCASHHNGVHFFNISTSKRGPNMVCFDTFHFQMCFAPQRRAIFHLSTFRPSGATKHWKNTVFHDFPTLSRTCIFSLLTFSLSDLLPVLSSLFWLSPCLSFFLAVLVFILSCKFL